MINRWHRTAFARPLGLALLFVAALLLVLALEPGQGWAAPDGQTSPVSTVQGATVSPLSTAPAATVSPLGAPTSTPSPTPTATSPVPPTAEPPSTLREWPTPTPTPYTAPVQAAIEYLTNDQSLAIANAELSVSIVVDDPVTGEELTVVRLRDPISGEEYWLRVDGDGNTERLSDFGEEALAIVADAEKIALSDLSVFQSLYSPFPFTRQLLWVGRIFNSKSGAQISIALDLAGEETGLDAVTEAEAAFISDYCGVLDVSLCVEMLYAEEGAESNVALVLVEESDPEPIVAFLDDLQVVYERDEETFYFRMQNDLLRELAQLEDIDTLQKDYPDEVRGLDSNLIIGLIEQAGALSLTLESQNTYPLLTYRVEAQLERVEVTQTQSITLLAEIEGIFAPTIGPSALAAARGSLALGKLSGRYNLSLAYTDPARDLDLLDSYILIVSDGRVVLRPNETTFSWASYPTWLRLPGNALWFVVQARSTDADGTRIDGDLEEFAVKAAAFYADVAGLRAQELSLAEGTYTNALFVPPWSTWQIPDGDFVQVPVNDSQSFLFKWPDIRYFTYAGSLAAIETVISEHCVDEVAIVGYTAAGDVLDVCQP